VTPLLRLGARTSPLARAQVDAVSALLAARGIATRYVGVTTRGDVDQRLLTEIGGTGIFAGAVREALRRGEIDVAVHSLKDLPTAPDDDLEVVAVPLREDTRDVLVGRHLDELADGDSIGTGAPRRALQLGEWAAERRRQVQLVPVRGNVDTRLDLVRRGALHAVVLAAAGLRRLGHLSTGEDEADEGGTSPVGVQDLRADLLGLDVMLPAPGQGALALEISRSLDPTLRAEVLALDHPESHAEVLVERGFLGRLEAGCTAPVGARAVVKSVRGTSLDLTLTAVIGRTLVSNLSEPTSAGPAIRLEVRGFSADPREFGSRHAAGVLDRLQSNE
jgi:hydroxymethylbilane synthase